MKTTFIYALKELAPGEFFSTKIRYIGKADDPYRRFEKHLGTKEKCHRGNWIRSLPARGLSLQLEILDEVPDVKSVWEFWEREYIRVFRAIGFDLVNQTAGGEGVSGLERYPEYCANISAAKLGEKNPMFGKPSPMRGKKYPPEVCEKNRQAQLGKNLPPEHCAKIGIAHRDKKTSLNTSGFVGVSWHKQKSKWRAVAQRQKKQLLFGLFSKIEDAVFARALALDTFLTNPQPTATLIKL